LIREMEFGRDGDFSEEFLVEKLNGELSADLGNLLSRTLAIAEKFSGEIKGEPEPGGLVDIKEISSHIDKLEIHEALEKIWRYVRSINKYVNDKKPWSVKGPELGNILYNVLESIRISAILLSPFIPETCEKIFGQLGVEAGGLKDAVFKEFKGKVTRGPNLFVKVQ
jgi:methionyl-tRNA synthetase